MGFFNQLFGNIWQTCQQARQEREKIMAKLDDLEAEVRRNREVDESAKALLVGLIAKLEAAKGDDARMTKLIADLKSSTDVLSEAVVANTPAETPAEQPSAPTP